MLHGAGTRRELLVALNQVRKVVEQEALATVLAAEIVRRLISLRTPRSGLYKSDSFSAFLNFGASSVHSFVPCTALTISWCHDGRSECLKTGDKSRSSGCRGKSISVLGWDARVGSV